MVDSPWGHLGHAATLTVSVGVPVIAQAASVESSIVQTVIQGGALGILLIIVFQIPRAFREMREWRQEIDKAHREERDALLRAFEQEAQQQRKVFKEENAAERLMCARNFDLMAKAVRSERKPENRQ